MWESVAVGLATRVITAAVRVWLGVRGTPSSEPMLSQLLAPSVPKIFDRRRAEREFAHMVDIVAAKTLPYLEADVGRLPTNEIEAAALAVGDTFANAELDVDELFSKNLNPLLLEKSLRETSEVILRQAALSEGGEALYDRLVRESCNYVVEVVSLLPNFEATGFRHVLAREQELALRLDEVLRRLPEDPTADLRLGDAAAFELEYRREVARRLDELELFGVDLPEHRKRYSLSVAYITLSASERVDADTEEDELLPNGVKTATDPAATEEDLDADAPVRVTAALAGHNRVLVRGIAGSGKTTLLQWLAVNAATTAFRDELEPWNGVLPFFVRLRSFAGIELPGPEDFIRHGAWMLLDEKPSGWVRNILAQGRGLILIDGVDELPEEDREHVRRWLRDLTDVFNECKFVVTSRPPAIDEGWLDAMDFEDTELQPMSTDDIDAFIDKWHDAAEPEPEDEERELLERYVSALKGLIRTSGPLRSLATNPLLCAMLCALNRERRTELPIDRMELYDVALKMLLDRRDRERSLKGVDVFALTLRQKYALLQDLALWLALNNRSDSSREEATGQVEAKIDAMPAITASGADVFSYLLERSGILREPVEGRIDFIHRTFQEYLAGKEAVDRRLIPLLVNHAHLTDWREIIILAAGHASQEQRDELLEGLLERGDRESAYRQRLHLLAVACLETVIELSPEVEAAVRRALVRLVPPRNMTEARSLASARELAVPLLEGYAAADARTAAACVRTLSLIRGDAALEALTKYGPDRRVTVAREIVRAWSVFDAEEYARRVMAKSRLNYGALAIRDPSLVPYTQYMENLVRLNCNFSYRDFDLEELCEGKAVSTVSAIGCSQISDLSGLRCLDQVRFLSLSACENIVDVSPLAGLRSLQSLYLGRCSRVSDVSPLGALQQLKRLSLLRTSVADIGALETLEMLEIIDLEGCEQLKSLEVLGDLPALRSVDVQQNDQLPSLEPLRRSGSIRDVTTSDCGDAVTELDWVPQRIESLDVSGCAVSSVEPLGACKGLLHLDLAYNPAISQIDGLSRLTKLEDIDLTGTAVVDLSPLSGLKGATIRISQSMAIKDVPEAVRKANRVYRLPSVGHTRLNVGVT